jgi:hypothetical protein
MARKAKVERKSLQIRINNPSTVKRWKEHCKENPGTGESRLVALLELAEKK